MGTHKVSVILPLLVPTPFLRAMTEFAIKTLRLHADNAFELVVVEAGGHYFDPAGVYEQDGKLVAVSVFGPQGNPACRVDKYLNFNPPIGSIAELNAGVDAASGDFLVFTGNDVFVPPHWDTELLYMFEQRKDCGAAALSAVEGGAVVGSKDPMAYPAFVEGMYSPFTMFRKGWRFDESYRKIYQDSDLIMRMYEAGLRSYRSNRARVLHLLKVTSDSVEPEKHLQDLAHDERLFYKRWRNSPLWMYGMMRSGGLSYGREWESWTRSIRLHHNPEE